MTERYEEARQLAIEAVEEAAEAVEPDSFGLSGPHAVGRYAAGLQSWFRGRPRLALIGEVTGLNIRAKAVYFELRDAEGAVRCSMWRNDFDAQEIPEGALRDGSEVVIGGGPEYYPGSATASPSFSFRATRMRLAGEGDLLAQLAQLRQRLGKEGLFEPQRALAMPRLPRTIGVITGRDSAALADVRAGLARRGWAGTLVLAHPPVQDRHAAPQIARALQDLAAIPDVEAIVVARGGGSLTDLWAFCDETLCRTVALLRVPVVAAVGHESDRTLIDDVAAVSCSTPTHAVEAVVAVDVSRARRELSAFGSRLQACGARAASARTRPLAAASRSLAQHMRAQRSRLHQLMREIRAAGRRALTERQGPTRTFGMVLTRKSAAARLEAGRATEQLRLASWTLEGHARDRAGRAATLKRLAATLDAHAPDRVLERGYAIVQADDDGDGGEVLTRAADARRAGKLRVRFADDHVGAIVSEDESDDV